MNPYSQAAVSSTAAPRPQPELWVGTPRPPTPFRPNLRLFCLPYAGGSAAIYREWGSLVPPGVEIRPIHLPGRERRALEPPIGSMEALIAPLCAAMEPLLDGDFAIFGHSMGAVIGHALTLALARRFGRAPRCLIVSGRQAPHLPERREPVHDLSDADFIAELRRLDGTPPAVLDHAELMAFMLPMLRADFQLIETYQPDPDRRLACPVVGFCADGDLEAPPEDVAAWGAATTGSFSLKRFSGGHFFINSEREALRAALAEILTLV